MATYGKKASDKVEEAMHERKLGALKSGRSGKKDWGSPALPAICPW